MKCSTRPIRLAGLRPPTGNLIKTWFAYTYAISRNKNQSGKIVKEPQRVIGPEACLAFVAMNANGMSKWILSLNILDNVGLSP